MSWLDSIGDFISDNSSWLKPVANAGVSLFNNVSKGNSQNQYIDYLKERENQNYQNSLNAYNQSLEAARLADANSAANAAASRAAASARAAAARQTEANRQKAAKKSMQQEQKTYKDLIAMYKPFADVALASLPQKQKTYQDSLNLQGMLNAYLNTPGELAKMGQAMPAYNINVPLPQELKK